MRVNICNWNGSKKQLKWLRPTTNLGVDESQWGQQTSKIRRLALSGFQHPCACHLLEEGAGPPEPLW